MTGVERVSGHVSRLSGRNSGCPPRATGPDRSMTEPLTTPPSDTPRPRSWRLEALDLLGTVAIGLAAAMAFQSVLFQPFTIPSSSMEPGLVTGDYIVVSKYSYGWSRASLPLNPPVFDGRIFGRAPARGDV